jgi:hypothetical protein
VLLRTVGGYHDHILLAARIDEITRLGGFIENGHPALHVHGDVHEQVDVSGNIRDAIPTTNSEALHLGYLNRISSSSCLS